MREKEEDGAKGGWGDGDEETLVLKEMVQCLLLKESSLLQSMDPIGNATAAVVRL